MDRIFWIALPIVRHYIKDATLQPQKPYSLAGGRIRLWPSQLAPSIALVEDASLRATHSIVLDVEGVHDRVASDWAQAAILAIQIESSVDVRTGAEWFNGLGKAVVFSRSPMDLGLWGHYDNHLETAAIQFADAYTEILAPLISAEVYSRVANAIRIYRGSLDVMNPDLALLGFVGTIESLFSISPQELSFRLSLVLSRFLADNPREQHATFERARELYVVRSKVAHGDKIAETEEAAAIQIVDNWTPEAEHLARQALQIVLRKDLIETFNQKRKHEELLTALLFAPNLDAALAGLK